MKKKIIQIVITVPRDSVLAKRIKKFWWPGGMRPV